MVSFKTCLFYTQTQGNFVIPVYIFNGRKQTLVDTIGILSALRMRGLHDKRHLLAKLQLLRVARIYSKEQKSKLDMKAV